MGCNRAGLVESGLKSTTLLSIDSEETVCRAFSGTFTKRHVHSHVTVTFSVKNERFTVDKKNIFLNRLNSINKLRFKRNGFKQILNH
jgi:hypothetical protein